MMELRVGLSCKLAVIRVGVPGNISSPDTMCKPSLSLGLMMLVESVLVSSQLVGGGGLVTLPAGWVYHDNLTLAVSKTAGVLAKELLAVERLRENERKVVSLQARERLVRLDPVPKYRVEKTIMIGSELPAEEVLAYGDSLSFSPPQDTRYSTVQDQGTEQYNTV